MLNFLRIKKPPDYGQEVTQMFSQRNNPYCELLSSLKYSKKTKYNIFFLLNKKNA